MRKFILGGLFAVFCLLLINSCQSPEELELAKYMASGRDLYRQKCQNCHGANGEGLGALSPPLTDSLYLKENKKSLACIVKNGMEGTVTVHGQEYEGKMPSFPELQPIDITSIIVYITNTHGNSQGIYTQEEVAADLANCK